MKLAKPQELGNLKFSEPASINIGDMKKITIRREDGNGGIFQEKTEMGEHFPQGNASHTELKKTRNTSRCPSFSTKFLYHRDDGTVTIYAKLKTAKGEILSTFYKDEEIGPMTYEGKHCEVKAALAIEGMIISEKKVNLQVKIHEAMVWEKVYEHVRLLDLEW